MLAYWLSIDKKNQQLHLVPFVQHLSLLYVNKHLLIFFFSISASYKIKESENAVTVKQAIKQKFEKYILQISWLIIYKVGPIISLTKKNKAKKYVFSLSKNKINK